MSDTYSDFMASPVNNTKSSSTDKTESVPSAYELWESLGRGSLSITITKPEKLEGPYALTAIIGSSDDIRIQILSEGLLTTSIEELVGSYLLRLKDVQDAKRKSQKND